MGALVRWQVLLGSTLPLASLALHLAASAASGKPPAGVLTVPRPALSIWLCATLCSVCCDDCVNLSACPAHSMSMTGLPYEVLGLAHRLTAGITIARMPLQLQATTPMWLHLLGQSSA